MARFVGDINAAHHRRFADVVPADNLVQGLLSNVRIPTAHMDVFSVFLQVLGDHLVSEASDPEKSSSLNRVREAVSAFQSDPEAAIRLKTQSSNINASDPIIEYL